MDSGPGFRKGDVGVIGFHERKTGGGLASPLSSGFLPPYRSTGQAFSGITMALRRPHKRMKMVVRRAFAFCMAVLPLSSPSGFRPSPE